MAGAFIYLGCTAHRPVLGAGLYFLLTGIFCYRIVLFKYNNGHTYSRLYAVATPSADILPCGRGVDGLELESVESNESGYTRRGNEMYAPTISAQKFRNRQTV